MKPSTHPRQGFTLTEMLVVITIVAILSIAAIPAIQSAGSAAKVSTGGNLVASSIDAARENAIAKCAPTAVAVLTTGAAVSDRVFTILQYAPPVAPSTTGTWAQASKWYILPTGIIVQPPVSPVVVAPALPLPALSYLGATYQPTTDYTYFILLENGSIFRDTGGTPVAPCIFSVKSALGNTSDYYNIIVNDSTGHTKIVRP